MPECLPDTVWDELDEIAASGERWHSLQSSQFARETPLLAALAEELAWQRDADPLTLMRRLNYALFHAFTYAQTETKVDSPIDDALKARAGVCQDLAHIMIALGAAHRHPVPLRQRISLAKLRKPRQVGRRCDARMGGGVSADARMGGIRSDQRSCSRPSGTSVWPSGGDYADVPPTRGVFRGEAGSALAVLVTVSLADSPIRPERVMPMTTWVAPEVAEPPEAFDQAQQQQQQ